MSTFIGANLTETYSELGSNTPGLGDIYAGDDGKRYRFVLFDNGAGNVAAVAGNFAYVLAVSGASAGQTNTSSGCVTSSRSGRQVWPRPSICAKTVALTSNTGEALGSSSRMKAASALSRRRSHPLSAQLCKMVIRST